MPVCSGHYPKSYTIQISAAKTTHKCFDWRESFEGLNDTVFAERG